MAKDCRTREKYSSRNRSRFLPAPASWGCVAAGNRTPRLESRASARAPWSREAWVGLLLLRLPGSSSRRSTLGRLEQPEEQFVGRKILLDVVHALARDHVVAGLVLADAVVFPQVPHGEHQVFAGNRHHRLEFQQRQPRVLGIAAPPIV